MLGLPFCRTADFTPSGQARLTDSCADYPFID